MKVDLNNDLKPGVDPATRVRNSVCRQSGEGPGNRPKAALQTNIAARRGVALIITLIMLSVITFMAVTFLVVSRREKGAVVISTDQLTARFAADTALERVKAEVIAPILGTTNANSFDLAVSTNFINWLGFDPTLPAGGDRRTNVNFQYQVNGAPLGLNETLQNLANLVYNPRPPVFVTNRLAPPLGSNDFRFYLDLNRNARYDTNGYWPELNQSGFPVTVVSNGITITNFLHFVGDPEWIGILERPDLPHSSSNRFIARYAYIVVPAGRTLDVNYIHNNAKQQSGRLLQNGFQRNQGVGPWEINLASFLVDLNTNLWNPPAATYTYIPGTDPFALQTSSRGTAFDDAYNLLLWRRNGPGNFSTPLLSISALFGARGVSAFARDAVDGYAGGPLLTNFWGLTFDQDLSRANLAWWGANSENHIFSTQDFFDRRKVLPPGDTPAFNPWAWSDRLAIAGTNNSSYDRYTFYRMLSQLGTDSTPDPPGRLNLNYVNVGGLSATNFVPWNDPDLVNGNAARGIPRFNAPGPLLFFTNAADRLLARYSADWRAANPALYQLLYATNREFGVSSIPVLVSNRFVYSPALHRVLQLAANLCDATTNRFFDAASAKEYPSVFRPVFRKQGNAVFIAGYTSVGPVSGTGDPVFAKPRDLSDPNDLAALRPDDNIYGVPWVIGAKKGLPNFNEFAMQTVFQITRKLEITRPRIDSPRTDYRTNMMYLVSLTNVVGVEAWNSYRTNWPRDVELIVANDLSMALTNDFWPAGLRTNLTLLPRVPGGIVRVPGTGSQQWRGYRQGETNSFLVPLYTNVVFVPELPYRFNPPRFDTDYRRAWETSQTFPQPKWSLQVTNRVRFILLDSATRRVLDYVQLDGLNGSRNLSEEFRDPDFAPAFEGMWSTNLLARFLPQGVFNQIDVSLGNSGGDTADWTSYGLNQPSGTTKDYEIDKFRVFMGLSPLRQWSPPIRNENLGTAAQVPFTPTRRISQYLTWQANDPLVHYLAGDLSYLAITNSVQKKSLKSPITYLENIGRLNNRYQPWGGNPDQATDPDKFNFALKDPLVRSSDDWQFPTNKFPNLGWLGRVHRGSPWQTVYLKASDVNTNAWKNWTGNGSDLDAFRNRPVEDRAIFDLFTTAFNENASRGRLSINQSGLAAWSGVFGGVMVLTNNASDAFLNDNRRSRQVPPPPPVFAAYPIPPVGPDGTNAALWKLVSGINRLRAAHTGNTFRRLGDILGVPELTEASPFLNRSSATQLEKGLNDAAYEWLPQQVLGLLQVGEPRFAVYAFGQTLRPANNSVVLSGPFQGICTNYQITAEVATRTVLRVENAPTELTPTEPRVVIESFNILPPD